MTALHSMEPVIILIAEDEEPIAAILATVIEDLGYRPLIAVDGRHALELARITWPALVITDLMMPRLTGADLIVALHAEAATTGRTAVPVILITAVGLHHARNAGADAVLIKPFDLGDLEALITNLLSGTGLEKR
jgi:DNA-binding response OmpR family regulator